MAFEDFTTKKSVVLVYTGEGKGKTSASLGLMVRALGADWKVAYVQFIKHWKVNEHKFIEKIQDTFDDNLFFYKGGAGFYKAGELSAKGISDDEHRLMAQKTFEIAYGAAKSGKYDLVICDEINNAVADGLVDKKQLKNFIKNRNAKTSICLTGRNFPEELLSEVDIATNMTKIKHHFDNKFLANSGIDF